MVGSDLLGRVELGAVGSLDASTDDQWYSLDQQGAIRLSLRWRFSDQRERAGSSAKSNGTDQ